MREVFRTADAVDSGITADALNWGTRKGAWSTGARGAFFTGGERVSLVDRSIAEAWVTGGTVSGGPAGELFGLDSVTAVRVDFTVPRGQSNQREGARRRDLGPDRVTVVEGVVVTSGLQTLLDLAAEVSDVVWEQVLESALRKKLTSIAEIEAALPAMSKARIPGVRCIRRVLALRPAGAPPTESLLETLAVQMIRSAGLPTPQRQVEVFTADGRFVARVDLAWPELGVFLELDGQGSQGSTGVRRREADSHRGNDWMARRSLHLATSRTQRESDGARHRRRARAGEAPRALTRLNNFGARFVG